MVSQKSTLFNEKSADLAAIKSLKSHIKFLEGELKMVNVIKSVDGTYYKGEFEEVSPDEVTQLIAEKQQQLQALEAIAPGNNPAQPAENPNTDPSSNDADPSDVTGPADATPPADANPPLNDTVASDPSQPADNAAPVDPSATPADTPPLQ